MTSAKPRHPTPSTLRARRKNASRIIPRREINSIGSVPQFDAAGVWHTILRLCFPATARSAFPQLCAWSRIIITRAG